MTCSLGAHSALATKISQDNKEPGTYYIYMYDSNEPGRNMIGELTLINTAVPGNMSSKYNFNYYGGSLNFNKLGYRGEVTVYEGITDEDDFSPTDEVNTNKDRVFYNSVQK